MNLLELELFRKLEEAEQEAAQCDKRYSSDEVLRAMEAAILCNYGTSDIAGR